VVGGMEAGRQKEGWCWWYEEEGVRQARAGVQHKWRGSSGRKVQEVLPSHQRRNNTTQRHATRPLILPVCLRPVHVQAQAGGRQGSSRRGAGAEAGVQCSVCVSVRCALQDGSETEKVVEGRGRQKGRQAQAEERNSAGRRGDWEAQATFVQACNT